MTQTKRRAVVSAEQRDTQLSQPTFGNEAGYQMEKAASVQLHRGDEDEGADEGTGGVYPDAGGGKDEESKGEGRVQGGVRGDICSEAGEAAS